MQAANEPRIAVLFREILFTDVAADFALPKHADAAAVDTASARHAKHRPRNSRPFGGQWPFPHVTAIRCETCGGVSRVAKGADCKSAGLRLRRFESYLPHHRQNFPLFPLRFSLFSPHFPFRWGAICSPPVQFFHRLGGQPFSICRLNIVQRHLVPFQPKMAFICGTVAPFSAQRIAATLRKPWQDFLTPATRAALANTFPKLSFGERLPLWRSR